MKKLVSTYSKEICFINMEKSYCSDFDFGSCKEAIKDMTNNLMYGINDHGWKSYILCDVMKIKNK